MTLYECTLGEKYKIIGYQTQDGALRDRFMSFGITKDKVCQIMSYSIKRLAVVILIDGMQVALRDNEAKMIIIEPYKAI